MDLKLWVILGIIFLVFAWFVIRAMSKPTESTEYSYGLFAF